MGMFSDYILILVTKMILIELFFIFCFEQGSVEPQMALTYQKVEL